MKTMQMHVSVLVIMVSLFLTPSVSNAQTQFGIRAGMNASNVSFDKLPSRGERYGYHVGVFADVSVSPCFMSIQPEISYSTKGTAYKPANERQTLNMNYVDFFLPVAFKLNVFDLQVGPFASYMTSTPDYTYYNDNKIFIDAFKRYDFGLTGGLSMNIHKLVIGLRYNQGFVDITKNNARAILGSGKNEVGQVSVGYKF
jgi:Outer membrane protein beta-barrel domain